MARKLTPSLDAVRIVVRDAGLRCTAARLAVLQHLVESGGPRTHAEVATALADRGFDRATIYRNLTELTEARLLTRMELGDHVWRFEVRQPQADRGAGEHPHFICTTCGEVSCLDGVDVAITPKPRAARVGDGPPRAGGRRIGSVKEVLLKGQCPQCE